MTPLLPKEVGNSLATKVVDRSTAVTSLLPKAVGYSQLDPPLLLRGVTPLLFKEVGYSQEQKWLILAQECAEMVPYLEKRISGGDPSIFFSKPRSVLFVASAGISDLEKDDSLSLVSVCSEILISYQRRYRAQLCDPNNCRNSYLDRDFPPK